MPVSLAKMSTMRSIAAVAPELGLLDLGSPVTERHHALAPGLHPAGRPTDLAGDPGHQQLLGVPTDLGPEPAPDVWCDHPHLISRQVEQFDERSLHAVGSLRRRPL